MIKNDGRVREKVRQSKPELSFVCERLFDDFDSTTRKQTNFEQGAIDEQARLEKGSALLFRDWSATLAALAAPRTPCLGRQWRSAGGDSVRFAGLSRFRPANSVQRLVLVFVCDDPIRTHITECAHAGQRHAQPARRQGSEGAPGNVSSAGLQQRGRMK